MVKKILLSLLIFIAATSVAHAESTFNDRKANLTEIGGLRVGYGTELVRIVLDMTGEVEYIESYAEFPSRMILDFKNTWLNPNVPREITLKSFVAGKVRIAQNNPTTVRLVIETQGETKLSYLNGGPKGKRFVIDLGKNTSKQNPELKQPEDDQKEREAKEKAERERKEKLERELKEKAELERKEKAELERKEKLERERKEKAERERKEKAERERKEKAEREKKSDKKKLKDIKHEPEPATDLDKDLGNITALTGKRIVIDPGHGGNDSGAIGPTGVMEKTVTLNVALELCRLLEAEGAEVIMTRETDRTVSDKGAKASDIEELGARVEIANRIGADIFISIHADSFTRPEARGTTGYYYSKSTSGEGQRLADCIRRNLVEQLGTPSRGTQPCNFYVVRHTNMPATLIELGFISNKDEEKLLYSEDGVRRAAQGILDGIEDYFG